MAVVINITQEAFDAMTPEDNLSHTGVIYTPATVVDEDGNPTGMVRMSHPGIDGLDADYCAAWEACSK